MKWEEVKLGNHVDFASGPAFKSKDFTDNPKDIPLIKGENIGIGCILWEKSKYYPEAEAKYYQSAFLELNDIVLAMDRPWIEAGLKFGWIKENDPPSLLVQRVARLRGVNGLSQTFLRYIVSSSDFAIYLKNIQGGVGVPHISGGQIKAFSFSLPPLPTQQKIASILSAYDDLIENNLKRIRLLEEAAQHLYREWFVRFRFPGWEEVEVVDGLPVGWERKALGKICTEISSGGTPDRGNPLYWASPEIQWVKTKELRDDFVFECEERISKEGLENSSAKIFPEGTILMAIYASPTLGRLGILTNEACFNQAMVGFKIDRNQTSTEFLYYKLLEERLPLNNMAIGAAQQNINVKKVKEYEVILPSLDLINTFSRITSPFFSQRRALGGQNQKLKEARDILLPRLMNQTIVV